MSAVSPQLLRPRDDARVIAAGECLQQPRDPGYAYGGRDGGAFVDENDGTGLQPRDDPRGQLFR